MAEVNSRLEEDIFEKTNAAIANGANNVQSLSTQELPEGFDDLPIELISLIDRWVDSRYSSMRLLSVV